jgi:hypothetical protein
MFRFYYIVKFYLSCTLIASILGCNENKEQVIHREIVLPDNLEIIEVDKSVSFDKSWFGKKIKVVVFIRKAGPYSSLDLDWNSVISEFEDVAFLFYVSEKDKTKLINHLKEVDFIHPIIHDPNEEFRKLNVKEKEWTFISFLVKNNEIIGMGNPSLPDFRDKINKLIKESE